MRSRPHVWCVLFLVVCAWAPLHGYAQEGFSLGQILSAPFPGNLTAAPKGGAIAWVFNQEGRRNIWVAEPPDYQARQLTGYSEDDGYTINDLTWAPDGRSLVFVRGDGPNRRGELPNPLSNPGGAERALYSFSLDNGTPRKLSDGSSPAVSPTGERVVFLKAGQLWSVPLHGEEKAAPLIKARGRSGSLRFSPGGEKLAFVSNRGDHAFIGVYDFADKSVRWIDPSVDRDGSPVWSPDGKQLAFIRSPSVSGRLPFMPRREGEPWSIWVADPATGRSREIWRAEPGWGSVFSGVVAENQLFWSRDGFLVFPWERTGWKLLYSVPAAASSSTAKLLTPGEFEVEDVAMSPDGLGLLYNSNQAHIDSRDLWQVRADGSGPPENLTPGLDIEWSPVETSEGVVAFLWSSATKPAQVGLLRDGSRLAISAGAIPPDFPSARLVTPEQVLFPGTDGLMIHGQLFLPPATGAATRHPAVMFFHGGSRRQMLLGFHYRGYYHNAYAMNQYLASRGYVVLSVNYRSGIGYGMEFREALNYGARGASEYKDVEGAGLYLSSRADVDPARIGLWGGSYGGYLTALGLARASDLFAAGVDLHGVHDWNEVIRNFAPDYDPAKRAEIARLAFASSPMASVDTWRSPVLLIHGDDDRNVPFSETVTLIEALRNQGVEFEQLIFPDEVHGFLLHRSWLAAYRAAADFFDRKLRQ